MLLEALMGPVAGIFGSIITSFQNYKMQQLAAQEKERERGHELAMLQARTQAMMAEVEANIRISEIQAAGAADLEAARAFAESQKEACRRNLGDGVIETMIKRGGLAGILGEILAFLLGSCDVLSAFIRPALTIYMTILATWVSYKAWIILEQCGLAGTDINTALKTWETALQFIFVLATTLISWWFGSSKLSNFAIDVVKKQK
ncbi:MAG: hypothetical protein FWG17_03070 [Desulfovibrionaceae bacterium]|nr:hypothetical protein [Desulfovibrionaceae bacterium]